MTALLLVRCASERLGLPVDRVLEIVPIAGLLWMPAACPAVRGLLPVRGRLVPLAHLRALLDDRPAPEQHGEAAILVRAGGQLLTLEVDEALDLVPDAEVSAPAGWDVPWALGVVRIDDALLPVVDLEVLVERLLAGAGGMR